MQTTLFPYGDYDKERPESARLEAIGLLAMAGDFAPVELFAHGLKHADKHVRIASSVALFRLQRRESVLLIRPLLQDDEMHIRVTAAWALACWGEPVPRELLVYAPDHNLRPWIAEALPPGWSKLFSLEAALACVGSYRRPGPYRFAENLEPQIAEHFHRLAAGVNPQPLIDLLRHDRDLEKEYGAWKLLQAQNALLPLDVLPELLSRYDGISGEVALQLGKQGMASAIQQLNEMWTLTDKWTHVALTIALDDLKVNDAVRILCSELQGKVAEAEWALWGLGILGKRGRTMPLETFHQMLLHQRAEIRAATIKTLSSLNDITLAETLMAVNDDRLEPAVASCHAFLALAGAGIDLPIDLLVRRYVQLQAQKYQYNGYLMRESIWTFLDALDTLHADIPLDSLIDALSMGFFREAVMRYWQRHAPDIFAEIMVQATAFLRQHL